MGNYTNNLFKRNKLPKSGNRRISLENPCAERIVSCALMRNNVLYKDAKTHSEIRIRLGDSNPHESNPHDDMGFITSGDRFINRREAGRIAYLAGQTPREIDSLLSSDIDL